jgi:hypothetical protein
MMDMNSTKQLKMKIIALKVVGQRKVYNFFGFSVDLGTKTKTN